MCGGDVAGKVSVVVTEVLLLVTVVSCEWLDVVDSELEEEVDDDDDSGSPMVASLFPTMHLLVASTIFSTPRTGSTLGGCSVSVAATGTALSGNVRKLRDIK
jgi:branched-subunit amino acid permease